MQKLQDFSDAEKLKVNLRDITEKFMMPEVRLLKPEARTNFLTSLSQVLIDFIVRKVGVKIILTPSAEMVQ